MKSTLPFGATILVVGFLVVAFAPAAPAAAGPDSVLHLWLAASSLQHKPPRSPTPSNVTAVDGGTLQAPSEVGASRTVQNKPLAATVTVPTTAPAQHIQGRSIIAPNPSFDSSRSYTFPSDVKFKSAAVVTLYLTAEKDSVINDVYARIVKDDLSANDDDVTVMAGSHSPFVDSTHRDAATNDNVLTAGKILKFEIALLPDDVKASPPSWRAGETLRLDLGVSALTVEGTPTDVKVVYGSTKTPSRVSVAVNALPTAAKGTGILSNFYLAPGKSFSSVAPSALSAFKRVTESNGMVNGQALPGPASIVNATAWSWGTTTLTAPFKADGDALVTVYAGPASTFATGALRAIRTILVFTPPGSTPIIRQQDLTIQGTDTAHTLYASAEAQRYAMAVNMSGVKVPAGTTLDVQFATWSSSNQDAPQGPQVIFSYGSSAYKASIQFFLDPKNTPASSSAAAPSSSVSAPSSPKSSSSIASPTSSSSLAAEGADGTAKGDPVIAKAKDIAAPADVPGIGAIALVAAVVATVLLLRRRS